MDHLQPSFIFTCPEHWNCCWTWRFSSCWLYIENDTLKHANATKSTTSLVEVITYKMQILIVLIPFSVKTLTTHWIHVIKWLIKGKIWEQALDRELNFRFLDEKNKRETLSCRACRRNVMVWGASMLAN